MQTSYSIPLCGLALVAMLAFGPTAYAQTKNPTPAAAPASWTHSRQMIVVTTESWDATAGIAEIFERRTKRSKWRSHGDPFAVVLGRGGLGATRDVQRFSVDTPPLSSVEAGAVNASYKKEGDGRSPAGFYPLTFAFGKDEVGNKNFPFTRLEEFTECVDDTQSNFYNRVVDRLRVGDFDWKSAEKMFQIVPEYDLGVFVGYNSYPVTKGAGSCIFLHIWKGPDSSTAGCTAMDRVELEKIVAWLSKSKNPYLVQMPREKYDRIQKLWKLPRLKSPSAN